MTFSDRNQSYSVFILFISAFKLIQHLVVMLFQESQSHAVEKHEWSMCREATSMYRTRAQ